MDYADGAHQWFLIAHHPCNPRLNLFPDNPARRISHPLIKRFLLRRHTEELLDLYIRRRQFEDFSFAHPGFRILFGSVSVMTSIPRLHSSPAFDMTVHLI